MPNGILINIGFIVLPTHWTGMVLSEPLCSALIMEEVVGTLIAGQLKDLVSWSEFIETHRAAEIITLSFSQFLDLRESDILSLIKEVLVLPRKNNLSTSGTHYEENN